MKTYDKGLDPAFWRQVREDDAFAGHRADLLKRWEEYGTAPIQELCYRDFKQYYDSGDRRSFEKFYFARRQGLNAAALMALIYPEVPEYLDRAMDHIFGICNEFTWVLPAHQKALVSFNPVHIDLFAAETALNLAEVYALLKDRLDPFILRRIEEELQRRILTPYKSRTFGWETAATNWTAVCTCGVAIAAMNVFPQEAEALVDRFEAAAASFLSGYGDDGFCPEGPMYWGYGFGFFVAYAERLRSFCGIDHFQNPKVGRMAAFFQKGFLTEDVQLTFADADPHNSYNFGIMHFLHNTYPNTVVVPPERHGAYGDRMARMCFQLRSILWYDPSIAPGEGLGMHYGADVQWLAVRQRDFGFAAKAGHNDEPHNHNDLGSFIYAKNGRQVLTDPGRAQYCRDYFREDTRYGFLHTSSRGHSVPIVDGQYQIPGREAAAEDVSWDGKCFSMELKRAYPVPELKSLRRSFTAGEKGVVLCDSFDCAASVTERFVAAESPAAEPGKLVFSDTVLTFTPEVSPHVERVEETVEGGKTQVLYLVDIPLPEGTELFSCQIE